MAKILQILDDESLGKITTMIREGKQVNVSVTTTSGHTLRLGDKPIFSFDCCRCGNAEHNAITSILEKLNENLPPEEKKWTRKKVSSLVSFGTK